MMPFSRIEPASSSSSASSKVCADCAGSGAGTRSGPGAGPPLARSTAATSSPTSPIRAARPRPSRDRTSSSAMVVSIVLRGRASAHAACSARSRWMISEASLQIGLRARALQVVEQHRLAVGRRLGDAHVARDDGLVDLVAHELRAHRCTTWLDRLLRGSNMVSTTPWMVSLGLSGRAHLLDRLEKLAEALQREELALQRHQHRVGRRHRVDGQEVQRRRAIDQHIGERLQPVRRPASRAARSTAPCAGGRPGPARAAISSSTPSRSSVEGATQRRGTAVSSTASPSARRPTRTS